ncbi:MFS transporter [Streptomyces ardesiacus]|uniref:MFS transporter n=1 Tax=Streptomyces ardesiacus TaxID=285564 RepID=UPI00366116EE
MRIAAGAWTAALLVLTVAGHWAVLLIVPVLTGIGSGITMPTLTVLVDRAAPTEQRGTATSLQATALFRLREPDQSADIAEPEREDPRRTPVGE